MRSTTNSSRYYKTLSGPLDLSNLRPLTLWLVIARRTKWCLSSLGERSTKSTGIVSGWSLKTILWHFKDLLNTGWWFQSGSISTGECLMLSTMEPLLNWYLMEARQQRFSIFRLYAQAASSHSLAMLMAKSWRKQARSTSNTLEDCKSVSMSSETLSRTNWEGDSLSQKMAKTRALWTNLFTGSLGWKPTKTWQVSRNYTLCSRTSSCSNNWKCNWNYLKSASAYSNKSAFKLSSKLRRRCRARI